MGSLKRILHIGLIALILLVQVSPVFAHHLDSPQAWEERDSHEPIPPPDVQSEATPSTSDPSPSPSDTPSVDGNVGSDEVVNNPVEESTSPTPPPVNTEQTGTQSNGDVGDTYINTGNGESSGNITTNANSNLSSSDPCCSGSTSIINDSNGANSDNSGSAVVSSDNNTNQNNGATVNNGLTGASVTGTNSASNNVGDSYIDTGSANTSGTIITSANTNVAGVSVSEFNIVDNHTGDYILDFGSNCVTGCDGPTTIVGNLNNGAGSNNDATIDQTLNNTTNQTNNADVNNDLNLLANTGDNTASGNTGGDSYITTGDANVSGNVLSFLNNNIAGNVIFGVVNIFGDLVGDIILPESALSAFGCAVCGADLSLINQNNGANSDNNLSGTQVSSDVIDQINTADINNNLILDAYTGQNSTSGNTGGDNYIKTGNADVVAQVLNIANTNLIGGDWWLVIINRAGQWIGQILGAPPGAFFAGSQGTEFAVGDNGEITAINSGNGTNSTNNANIDQTVNNNISQNNNANIDNNIKLSANTGRNNANDNTGGDNYITTGDANIIASLVNYVNNNIVGGRLLVTFVNVFGNWMGDFITPGQQKISTQGNLVSNGQGGVASTVSGGSGGNNSSQSGSGGSSSSNGGSQLPNIVVAAGTFGQGSFGSSSEGSDVHTQIAGLSFSKPIAVSENNGKKTIHLNLAWFLLLIPLFLLPIIYKLVRKIINIINSARERRGYV